MAAILSLPQCVKNWRWCEEFFDISGEFAITWNSDDQYPLPVLTSLTHWAMNKMATIGR